MSGIGSCSSILVRNNVNVIVSRIALWLFGENMKDAEQQIKPDDDLRFVEALFSVFKTGLVAFKCVLIYNETLVGR